MRLFAAIELDECNKKALGAVQAAMGRRFSNIQWIPPDRLHLTLKFLGEVPDRDVDAAARAVVRVCEESAGFDLEIHGAGCFPERGAVRVVWAGVHEETGNMVKCADGLDRALYAVGIPRERRPFSPHLTLARLKRDGSAGGLRAALAACSYVPLRQAVSNVRLMSSDLTRHGPVHTPICTARLATV